MNLKLNSNSSFQSIYPAQKETRQIQIIEQFSNFTFIIYSKEYKSPTGWISQIDLNLWLGCIRSKNMLAKRKISLWTWGWCILMRGRQRGKRPGWRQRRTCRTTPRRKYPGKMRWNASYKCADALRRESEVQRWEHPIPENQEPDRRLCRQIPWRPCRRCPSEQSRNGARDGCSRSKTSLCAEIAEIY